MGTTPFVRTLATTALGSLPPKVVNETVANVPAPGVPAGVTVTEPLRLVEPAAMLAVAPVPAPVVLTALTVMFGFVRVANAMNDSSFE
jgi:hypothetical protein